MIGWMIQLKLLRALRPIKLRTIHQVSNSHKHSESVMDKRFLINIIIV